MLKNSCYTRLCRARDMLRETDAEVLSLTHVAEATGLSVYHLIRSFKSTFGQTPNEFRTHIRIEKAKHLLIASDYSVTDICMEIGYSSLGSFSTLFLRHTGLPPSDYRRQLRAFVSVPGTFPSILIPYCFAGMYGGAQFSPNRQPPSQTSR